MKYFLEGFDVIWCNFFRYVWRKSFLICIDFRVLNYAAVMICNCVRPIDIFYKFWITQELFTAGGIFTILANTQKKFYAYLTIVFISNYFVTEVIQKYAQNWNLAHPILDPEPDIVETGCRICLWYLF